MSEWISCDDRLPTRNTAVLVHYVTHTKQTVQSVALHFESAQWRQLVGGHVMSKCNGVLKVTHWMPLPSPPLKLPEPPK